MQTTGSKPFLPIPKQLPTPQLQRQRHVIAMSTMTHCTSCSDSVNSGAIYRWNVQFLTSKTMDRYAPITVLTCYALQCHSISLRWFDTWLSSQGAAGIPWAWVGLRLSPSEQLQQKRRHVTARPHCTRPILLLSCLPEHWVIRKEL